MNEESWRFRVTRGVVTVREGELAIRSTPGYLLAGQRVRWAHGDRWERGRLLLETTGLLWSVFGIVYHLSQVGVTGIGLGSAPHAFAFVLFAYLVWSNHLGEKTIPLSSVERITLDGDDGTLVVTHEADFRSPFRNGETETTLSLPTRDDVREAEDVFRLRGIELADPGANETGTETRYRVLVRDGACFCERCRSQVSPSDGTCPACGYALRVRERRDRTSEARSGEAEPGS